MTTCKKCANLLLLGVFALPLTGFPANNPAPRLSSLSPAFSTVGAGALTLTLNGASSYQSRP